MRLALVLIAVVPGAVWACGAPQADWEVAFERASPAEQFELIKAAHAQGAWQRVVVLAPKFKSSEFLPSRIVKELEALSMLKVGHFSKAMQAFDLLLAQSPDSGLEAKRAEASLRWAMDVGTTDRDAVELLQKRLRERALDVDGQVTLARFAARTGQRAEQRALCDDLLRREPASVEVFRVCRGAESKVVDPKPVARLKPCG
ncbi:MAG: hypothetical protein SFW67_19005 [Myxococcaceae bacterium]|nr:hypothetical protein [Myxococcaceae bacterium]